MKNCRPVVSTHSALLNLSENAVRAVASSLSAGEGADDQRWCTRVACVGDGDMDIDAGS